MRVGKGVSAWFRSPAWLLSLVAAMAALGCGDGAPAARRVLLISIDTCRADHLGCYGHKAEITPNIDAVAADGVVFTEAYASAPLTRPAHSTMLTGKIPPQHGVRDNAHYVLGDEQTTLAEILASNGLTTGAVVSAFVLDSRFGFAQGFDTFDDEFASPLTELGADFRLGGETSARAVDWLAANGDRDFFLFLHFWDPHVEYHPPEPFAGRFAGDPYAGEIAYTDHCIGRVVDELKSRGLYDSTVIVITADHGEMLGEHGEATHGFFVYRSVVRVPLIIKPAGPAVSARFNRTVSLADIVPTVCALLGVSPVPETAGRDLSPLIHGRASGADSRGVYSESLWPTKYGANPLISVVSEGWQLIETTRPELYDLVNDPEQSTNLAVSEPARLEEMRRQLESLGVDDGVTTEEAAEPSLDRESRDRLRALGYTVDSAVREGGRIDASLDDPKDLIGYHLKVCEVETLMGEHRLTEARSLLEEMIRERPDAPLVNLDLGMVALEQGASAEAVAHLERYAAMQPQSTFAHLELGFALAKAGDSDRAIASYRTAVAIDPSYGEALAKLGIELNRVRRFREAVEPLQRAVAINPESSEAHAALGVALARVGHPREAEPHYREAIELAPEDVAAVNNLGLFLVVNGRAEEAVELLLSAVDSFPDRPELHFNLALAYRRLDRVDEAVDHYRKVVSLAPDAVAAHLALGELLYQRGEIIEAVMHFERALHLDEDSPQALNGLAWVFATSENIGKSDVGQAASLARRACELTGYGKSSYIDTLAAALARAGLHAEAVDTALRAAESARSAGNTALAENIDERIELYRRGGDLRSTSER